MSLIRPVCIKPSAVLVVEGIDEPTIGKAAGQIKTGSFKDAHFVV
jgi:hypothetical protein